MVFPSGVDIFGSRFSVCIFVGLHGVFVLIVLVKGTVLIVEFFLSDWVFFGSKIWYGRVRG